MGIHRELNIDWVDLDPSTDDKVLGASTHLDIAVSIHAGEISGAKPSVRMERAAGRLFVAVVTRVLERTAGLEMALFSGWKQRPVVVDNARLVALPGLADCPEPQGCRHVQGVHDGNQHLAHTPDLIGFAVKAGLVNNANCLLRRWRAANEATFEALGHLSSPKPSLLPEVDGDGPTAEDRRARPPDGIGQSLWRINGHGCAGGSGGNSRDYDEKAESMTVSWGGHHDIGGRGDNVIAQRPASGAEGAVSVDDRLGCGRGA